LVLRACPSVVDYAPGRTIRHYAELRQVAELLRTFLGISPSAWETAIEVLGEVDAVLTIVMIHEKGESIRSAGGYLRQLTQKRRDGAYAVGPMLMALLNTQLRAQTAAAGSCHPEGATK
jgi:replication initiation protein RepC